MYGFVDTIPGSGTGSTSLSIQTVFNGINLDEELTDENGSFITLTVSGRSNLTQKINTIEVPGMDGLIEQDGAKLEPREITVKYKISDRTNEGFRKRLDKLNSLLEGSKKELMFTDEDALFYATLLTNDIPEEESNNLVGTITFLCSDPFKYGPEKTVETTSDTFIVENEGTADANPIIELTATQKATFAMISNGEEYNLVGKPSDVDQQLVDEKVVVLDEIGDTIDTWQPAPGFNGTFVNGSQGIQVGDWGSGTGWHGPGAIKEIDPIQDFEIEFFVYVRSETADRTFRISTNYYDEHMNELGMFRLWDNSNRTLRKVVEARVGPYVGDFVNYLISSRNYDLREQRVWGGIIRVERKGNVFTFYAARITQMGRHVETITQSFIDVNNKFSGKLKFIRIDIANYGNTEKPNEAVINRIRVTEHKKIEVDQTPYIVYPGDVITFDHSTADILLNGESRKDLKVFGGSFFALEKGINTLTITPENVFNTKITYRERYK